MDCGVVGTVAAGIVKITVASVSQRLFLVSGAEAINPQQYQQARTSPEFRRQQTSSPAIFSCPNLQVCRELVDTKSRLEKTTEDLMSNQAAFRALEDQVRAILCSFSLPSNVADVAFSCKKRKKQPRAGVCSCAAGMKLHQNFRKH